MGPPDDIHNLIGRIRPGLLIQLFDVCQKGSPVGLVRRRVGKIHVVSPREVPIRLRAGDLAQICAEVLGTTVNVGGPPVSGRRIWSREMPLRCRRGSSVLARH